MRQLRQLRNHLCGLIRIVRRIEHCSHGEGLLERDEGGALRREQVSELGLREYAHEEAEEKVGCNLPAEVDHWPSRWHDPSQLGKHSDA